jgi:DNA invertase Pin-like site-specific DNA recombinase
MTAAAFPERRTMTKAVSYLRVSSEHQVAGDGFVRQREAVALRARVLGVELVDEYRDEGISGTAPFAERPALAALLERVATNGVRLVLVEKADRLARDLIEGELILRECRRLGVRVVEAEGGHDLTAGDDGNPTSVLVRQILGAVAQFEKSALVSKLRAARARKRAATGRCEGVKPFGGHAERPDEVATLKRIRDLRHPGSGRQRASFVSIAELLNVEGRRPRTAARWTPALVRNALAP